MEGSEQLTPSTTGRGRVVLALWIIAPIVGLYVVLVAVSSLDAVDCGEGGGASGSEEALVLAVTALLSLAAFVGAAVRMLALRRAGRAWLVHGTAVAVGVGAALLIGLVAALAESEPIDFFVGAGVAGIALTGIALLGLLVAWAAGRGVEGAGGLLPLYLTGAGLFCYPVVLLIGLIAQSGIGC